MKTKLLLCLLSSVLLGRIHAEAEKETRYLAFQIFTWFSPDPKVASLLSSGSKAPLLPGTAALRDYVLDIKQRIGSVGDPRTRLAVVLGPLCFEQDDDTCVKFIERAFDLALETDVAVGFHIDDSEFWLRRQDLWSDPQNVEAMDWDGTPSTGRRLDWSKKPSEAPPQMCFNSKVIQREARQRAALIGRAVQAGVMRLQKLGRPELFAGVIAGWETMIGQDFKTGKYLGYRALMNRGFTREHPPQDMNVELEKVVQEWIDLWTAGLAEAGVSPEQIYSHTAFLSRRSFGLGDSKDVTYMKHDQGTAYSQHNHFAPPSVAFGRNHRPGFSTYPQPGLFEDIYAELKTHQQTGWASCEGTDMQPSSGPGQTGMNMETYLAKMFNHGATLVNLFSWGVGGDAMKTMGFRVVTEGEDALQAYRKFLNGGTLVEGKETLSLMERLPAKIHQIQAELPAWIQKTGSKEALALMQTLQEQTKAKNFIEAEKTADSILSLMGVGASASAQGVDGNPPPPPLSSPAADDPKTRLSEKVRRAMEGAREWAASGRDPSAIAKTMEEKFKPLIEAGKMSEAEAVVDQVLEQLKADGTSSAPPAASAPPAQDITEEVREKLAHNIGCAFLLFRSKVLAELKVTPEQKGKLDQQLRTLLPEAMQALQQSNGARGKYNQKAHEETAAVLKGILNDAQRTRLHQLELQKEMLFGPSWNMKELQITDAQQQQFMAPIQETQKKTMALMAELHQGASPEAIRPQAFQLRLDLETQLETLLTDAQKKQWKEMLGQPVDPGVIYGGL